jgi:hypothetical protein
MKIAYVVAEGLDKKNGVSKKIYNQINYWVSKGNEVKLFYFSNKALNPLFNNIEFTIVNHKHRLDFVLNKKYIYPLQEWSPNIIYFRTYLYCNTFSEMLKRFPSILEINSDDVEESKVAFSLPVRYFHMLTRELILKKSAGMVCVTHELQNNMKQYSSNIITIPNGLNGSFIGKKDKRKSEFSRLQVLFLGSPNQSWHGLDKIQYLAEELPEIDFHIIGTKELESIPDNLMQYGFLTEEEYLKILEKCDVAIGTLALHRKAMSEACPLKTREYLKYGLPTIIGYHDSDFTEQNPEFLLQLPNVENNVRDNIHKIREFILNSRDILITDSDVQHLFLDYKEKTRLSFMNKIGGSIL